MLKSRLYIFLPTLVFAIFMMLAINKYGVNLPYYDQYDMITIYKKIDNNSLGFGDLWKQHNEHRVIFPEIVMIINAKSTNWNVKAEMYISLIIATASSAILAWLIARRSRYRLVTMATLIITAAWFFSPAQAENWLWGWELTWFMCIASVLAVIAAIELYFTNEKKRTVALYAAISCGIIASFSVGGGILIWPIGLGLLIMSKPKSSKDVIIWSSAAAFSIIAYYHGYNKPEDTPSPTTFLHQPKNTLEYLFTLAGRPISDKPEVAILIGAILLFVIIPISLAVWLNRKQINELLPWIAISIFALAGELLTTLARAGAGVGQAMSSRYTAFSLLYIVGIIGLSSELICRSSIRLSTQKIIVLIYFSVMLPLLISSYTSGLRNFDDRHNKMKEIKVCTSLNYPNEACIKLASSRYSARDDLEYLKTKHWAGY